MTDRRRTCGKFSIDMSLALQSNGRGPDPNPRAWDGILDLRQETVLRQWVQVHGDHGFVSDYAALLWSDMQRLEEERARQCKAAEEAARQRQVQEEEARRRQIEEDLAKQRQASEEAAMLRADIEATIQRRTSEEAEKPQSEERSEDEGSDSNNPFPPAIGQLQATDEVRAKSFFWVAKT